MEAKIGITQDKLAAVAQSLGRILADEFVLYTKTRKAHWNVEGADFYGKHKFFEEQYTQLSDIVDDVAERIRKLGHYAPASLKQYLDLTHLIEDDRGENDSAYYIRVLLADHESILIHLRENINDYAFALKDIGSSDYITSLMESHETMAWMLRASLRKSI